MLASQTAFLRTEVEHRDGASANGMAATLLGLLVEAEMTFDRDVERARVCVAHAHQLLSAFCEPFDDGSRDAPSQGLARWQSRRVCRYVEDNLHANIRAEDLAQVARLSISHFTRAFSATFSETPYAYVLSRRIVRAKEMMVATEEPLAQIALSCGMADQAHFSKLFKRLTGESPSQWRRRNAVRRAA